MKPWIDVKGIIISMIEKAIAYKKTDKDFISILKKLGLSKDEINFILKKSKRKKFEDGGDSGGSDSGPGGSDDGSSSGVGSGEGESTGDANDQGGTEGPSGPGAEGGFGIGPGDDGPGLGVSDTFGQDVAEEAVTDVDMSMPALQTPQEKAMANLNNQLSMAALAGRALGSMVGMGNLGSMIGSSIGRGVTGPDDYSQAQTSVQTGPTQGQVGQGGIATLPLFAPITNKFTGDNTRDALLARYMSYLRSQRGY